MKQVFTIILSLILFGAFSQTPDWQWVKTIDGSGVEVYINDIAKDNSGNIYIAGSQKSGNSIFGDSVVSNAGSFIAKINSSGSWVWAVKAGTNYGNATIRLSSTPSGNIQFAYCGTVGETFGNLTAQDTFTSTNSRLIVGQINPSGTFTWLKTAATGHSGYSSISVDAAGNTYAMASGSLVGKLNTQGNWEWLKPYQGSSYDQIKVSPNGKIFVAGATYDLATYDTFTYNGFGSEDVFVSEIDSNGNWLWIKGAGGSGTDRCYGISVNNADEVFLTGYYRNSATFGSDNFNSPSSKAIFVSKLSSSGTWIWTKSAGGLDDEDGESISTDATGNAYVTGNFAQTATFGSTSLSSYGSSDIFVSKLDNQGNFLWSAKAGSTDDDGGSNILFDGSGNLYVVSNFFANATYGSLNVPFANSTGACVGKMNSTVGINEPIFSSAPLYLFPNPASTFVTVSSLSENFNRYQLFNSIGELVSDNQVTNKTFAIDISKLSSGVYYLRLKGNDFERVNKFIKE